MGGVAYCVVPVIEAVYGRRCFERRGAHCFAKTSACLKSGSVEIFFYENVAYVKLAPAEEHAIASATHVHPKGDTAWIVLP